MPSGGLLPPGDGVPGASETSELWAGESDVVAMYAILVGPDRELETALRDQGVETTRLEEPATGESLDDARVADADLLVVTDVAEATAVPIAREANPDVRIVIYAPETMPEFVRGQVDLAVAPGVLSPDVIAAELAGNGE